MEQLTLQGYRMQINSSTKSHTHFICSVGDIWA